MLEAGVNCPLTSSCGRLFDAVSALLGVRTAVNYEGQAAIEMEMIAAPDVREVYDWTLSRGSPATIDASPLIRGVVVDLRRGVEREVIAARFHNTVAAIVAGTSAIIRESTGVDKVALSGGVFQNVYLLGRTIDALAERGFQTYVNHLVPTNDGGIALGQAVVASARTGKEGASRVSSHSGAADRSRG
jgi:hydrogenase maturation protein HypF